MSTPTPSFRESNLFQVPIRDLSLAIEGTRLAPLSGRCFEAAENAALTGFFDPLLGPDV